MNVTSDSFRNRHPESSAKFPRNGPLHCLALYVFSSFLPWKAFAAAVVGCLKEGNSSASIASNRLQYASSVTKLNGLRVRGRPSDSSINAVNDKLRSLKNPCVTWEY